MIFTFLVRFWAVVALAGFSIAELSSELKSKQYYDHIIEAVNSGGNHWQAGHNFEVEELSTRYNTLAGTFTEDELLNSKLKTTLDNDEDDDDDDDDVEVVGKNGLESTTAESDTVQCPHGKGVVNAKEVDSASDGFDGRVEWKHCPTVNQIWNQGACSSDWAIAAASAIADRICIATNGSFTLPISPERPLACCKSCGWGCRKGYPAEVWKYWAKKGLVTGGQYKSNEGCQQYSINPHRGSVVTPRCRKRCFNKKYDKTYRADIVKGKHIFQLWCPGCTGGQVKNHGPVTASLAVFEDFLFYKSGVYHHVHGKRIGSLSVRILGYDMDQNNVSYWIAANSWGTSWGENGFFKIRRWVNECAIESSITGGSVRLSR